MKLPETKKERVLLLCMAVLAVVAVIHLTNQLAIRPFLESRRVAQESRSDLDRKIRKAQKEVDLAPRHRRSYEELTAQIREVSDAHVLHPVLGSYLLAVQEDVENMAIASGVDVDFVREIGIVEIPGKQDKQDRAFKAYSVQVAGGGSYRSLVELIGKLEESNPYLCVSKITVTARAEDPVHHRIGFNVQWPIWRDPSLAPAPAEAVSPETQWGPGQEEDDEDSA